MNVPLNIHNGLIGGNKKTIGIVMTVVIIIIAIVVVVIVVVTQSTAASTTPPGTDSSGTPPGTDSSGTPPGTDSSGTDDTMSTYCIGNSDDYRYIVNKSDDCSTCCGDGWSQQGSFKVYDEEADDRNVNCIGYADPIRNEVLASDTCGISGWSQAGIFYTNKTKQDGDTTYCVGSASYKGGVEKFKVQEGTDCGTEGWTHQYTFNAQKV